MVRQLGDLLRRRGCILRRFGTRGRRGSILRRTGGLPPPPDLLKRLEAATARLPSFVCPPQFAIRTSAAENLPVSATCWTRVPCNGSAGTAKLSPDAVAP